VKGLYFLLLAGSALNIVSPAFAQTENAQGRMVYDAGFFAQFAPSSALQIVERVPGFKLDAGDSSVRGFGQAAGNLVINGQRPSSKSDSLDTILARIPASRVLRVEIGSGNDYGADYAGKAQVVNLLLSEQGGLVGTVEAQIQRDYSGETYPMASMSAIWRKGESSFSGSVKYQKYGGTEEGFDHLTALPSGQLLELRDKVKENTEPFKTASLGWALEQAKDRSLHLNAKISIDPWNYRQSGLTRTSTGTERDELYTERHVWKTYEVSGDITRPFAGGALKLNLLANRRNRDNVDTSVQHVKAALQGGFLQLLQDTRDESVARLGWSRAGLHGWSVEAGGEGAFNRLESDLDFFNIDASNARTKIDLPIDDATVAEYRGEVFVNAGRNLARDLHLDMGLTYEFSRLTVRGDVSARRVLKFLKPKLSVDWTPGGWHAQLSLRRTVNQLAFEDFVSGATFLTNQVNSGNAELQPQRAWEMLLSADHKLLGDGRVKIELGYNRVSQVEDRIPTANGQDSPGNLGTGNEVIARTTLDLPLGDWGIRGGRLNLYGSYVKSAVRDPYTLRNRRFSGNQLFLYTAAFRQDLGRFAWGVDLAGNTGSTSYRRNETDDLQGVSPKVSAFVEYRPDPRTTATLGARNLTDDISTRTRIFYAPDRTSANPVQREYRERNAHVLLYFGIKRNFG
jgi:hypothetical protein